MYSSTKQVYISDMDELNDYLIDNILNNLFNGYESTDNDYVYFAHNVTNREDRST